MVEPAEKGDKGVETAEDRAVREFVSGLSEESRMLVVLKAQLYDGRWSPMVDDLRNRLNGKHYIFKLANRIQDDIERIERMMEFESEHEIDLADHVEIP